MDESERLVSEIQELVEVLRGIKEAETKVIDDPDLQQSVLTVIVMEKTLDPNDPRIFEINKRIKQIRKTLSKKRDDYHAEQSRLCRELEALTRPAIQAGMQRLDKNLRDINLNRRIVKSRYDGFKEETFLTIETNEEAVLSAKEIIQKGLEKLRTMNFESVTRIKEFVTKVEEDFKKADLDLMIEKNITETDFYRFQSPLPGSDLNYTGPRSGLR